MTNDQLRAISQSARAVQDGAAAGFTLLDEPLLTHAQALADEAQSIGALCLAYTRATHERDTLREVLIRLDGFNVFDFDPCTMDELTAIKDEARKLIDGFPEA